MTPNKEMIRELKQFGSSHVRNGERRTADLLFRAADHIAAMEKDERRLRERIERMVEARSERAGA